jgi:uncharacterized protein YbjT (DUF2867 family)
MKVLVTGGSGVIGAGVVPELLRRGHRVRLLSRHADQDALQWEGVEPFRGNVSDAASIRGAATGCDAVVHIAGIVSEEPPELTFDAVNVGGTRNILEEARRASVRRFVYLSSLGADRGSSDYHRSKRAAEALVKGAPIAWTILRPGNVFGPGDEVISMILKLVRALPAVPVIGDGRQPFQPIWYEDLGKAVAAVLEREDLASQTLELAGDEVTSMDDLVERFRDITGRKVLRVPVPESVAGAIVDAASAASVELPTDQSKLTMLREHNVLDDSHPNALTATLGITPTPLDDALRVLADAMPEQLPEDGFGSMEHKRFWADIRGTSHTPATLMAYFREHVNDVMPIEFAAEPDVPVRVERGATLTAHLPLRGNIQVRVEVAEPTRVVLGTIEGHPLAGIVEFTTSASSNGVQFTVDVYARAANFFDFFALRTVGKPMQESNWIGVVQRMIDVSGGTSDGVHKQSEKLDGDEAKTVAMRVRSMVDARKRDGDEITRGDRPS